MSASSTAAGARNIRLATFGDTFAVCLTFSGPASLQGGIVEPVGNVRFKLVEKLKAPAIRVLVAEDHPIVADGILAILAKAEDIAVVGRARDGAEAIEMVKQHQPDIVLLDLRMPLVDGIGVASWIRDSGSTARTVFLTMFHSEEDVSQAIRAGANAYLLKDTPPEEIVNTIRGVHRRKDQVCHERTRELAQGPNSADLNSLELEMLALIVQGNDNRTIGVKLGLRTEAVKYHLRALFSKLGVRKRAAAARQALERGLLGTGI